MSSFQCKTQGKHIQFFDESFGEEKRKNNAVGKYKQKISTIRKCFENKPASLFFWTLTSY